jgi:hypothetical protein
MSRKNRFFIAAALGIALIFAATGVWAAPTFQGVVDPLPGSIPAIPAIFPLIPVTGGECLAEVNMGTAIFRTASLAPETAGCIIVVELVVDAAGTYAPVPEGKAFYDDAFSVTAEPVDTLVRVCYSYPPAFADKGAKVYQLDETVTPKIWVEIPNAGISDGTICASSAMGVVALIGTP